MWPVVLGLGLLLAATTATAAPLAPCAFASGPTSDPPRRFVTVSILSVSVGSGEDTDFLFFTDRADLYGRVSIGSDVFALPRMDGSDWPHWDDTNGRFTSEVDSDHVPIRIRIWDDDGAVSGDNDEIDLNPAPDKRQLDFEFDLCSLRLSGDIEGPSQGVVGIAGIGNHAGRIRFKVEIPTGRPNTDGDLALLEADLIQVVPQTGRLVAGKPTVVMVRIANNTGVEVGTSVKLDIFGGGITAIHEVLPLDRHIGAGEVYRQFFHVTSPLVFPEIGSPPDSYEITFNAQVDPGGVWRDKLPVGDCRRVNDSISEDPKDGLHWKVVPAYRPGLLWYKTGMLLDVTSMCPDSQFDQIRSLSSAFIKGVYPVPDVTTTYSTVSYIPPVSAVYDFVATLCSIVGIPLDAADPVVLTAELNAESALISAVEPHDVIMGVLPSSGWFERSRWLGHVFWEGISGFSLGEVAQHAVIFVPRIDAGAVPPGLGPAITLPAHELGHTMDLSVDPRLKDVFFCGLDDPLIGPALCAITGGLDEYKHDEVELRHGNPARGFWVRQGGEPPEIVPLVDKEQCDSRCLMGSPIANDYLDWEARKHWIDAADYEHAFDRQAQVPDPAVIYVSGMIDLHDRVFLWPWYRLANGKLDRATNAPGLYQFVFLDGAGQEIQRVGIPLSWKIPDAPFELPVTIFGLYLPDPAGTRRIQIWNVVSNTVLAERIVSSNAPTVQISLPTNGLAVVVGNHLPVAWAGQDADGDLLEYSVMVRSNGLGWSPVAMRLTNQSFSLPTDQLGTGNYSLKVVAADGANLGMSPTVDFVVQPPPAFVTNQIPAGYSTIANHYNRGSNTLNEVMPQALDGTLIYKWNFNTQTYESSTYDGLLAAWSPNRTLAPGEGAFLYSPSTQTFVFTGQIPPAPAGVGRPLFAGKYFRSARWPAPSSFESVNGFSPAGGDRVLLYGSSANAFPTPTSTHVFSNGVWSPLLPLLLPGKSAFVDLVALPSVIGATNKTVECGAVWTFDPPTNSSGGCCTNLGLTEVGTFTNRGPCQTAYMRSWRVTDCCSNSALCVQTVTVVDSTPPTIQCPTGLVVNCSWGNGSFANFAVAAADVCDPNPSVVCVPPSGSYFPAGTTLVTCVARDACGNSNGCSFPVTVLTNCPPPPVLSAVRLSGDAVQLCWPAALSNCALQGATTLVLSNGWQDLNLQTTVANGQRCAVLNNAPEAAKFFRLRFTP